jgi:hypothetical protein
MATSDWAPAFFGRHTERIPRADWPDSGEFWETFQRALVRNGVTEGVADEASRLMAEHPTPFLDRHIEAFLDQVRAVWKLSEIATDTDPATREGAERLSRGCPDCGGMGLTTRYRHAGVGQPRPDGRPLDPTITLYCTCSMGRWIERTHREKDPEVRRRIADLAEHRSLRLGPVSWCREPDNAHRYPPGAWDYDRARPSGRVLAAISKGQGQPGGAAARRRDTLPHLDHPTPSVAEVDGKLIRRRAGTIEEAAY